MSRFGLAMRVRSARVTTALRATVTQKAAEVAALTKPQPRSSPRQKPGRVCLEAERASLRRRACRFRRAAFRRRRLGRVMGSQTLTCRIGAGLSSAESAREAAAAAAREARGGALGRAEVDLAFVFLSQ